MRLSTQSLARHGYTAEQVAGALGPVFAIDKQLITDGTYFVVETEKCIIGGGGWSKRSALYGANSTTSSEQSELDPKTESAHIRSFFVHPNWMRRGIGRSILFNSETAISRMGFKTIDLIATPMGQKLFARFGYCFKKPWVFQLDHRIDFPCMLMVKNIVQAEKEGRTISTG